MKAKAYQGLSRLYQGSIRALFTAEAAAEDACNKRCCSSALIEP
jgi:hypothetical protein